MNEYTEPWWDDSYRGWLCAVSDANLKKLRQVQDEIEETTPDEEYPSEGKSKGKGKEKRKGEGLLQFRQHRKGKERARSCFRRNSGHSTTLASSQGSGIIGGQKTGKVGAKAHLFFLVHFPQHGCVNSKQ